MGCICIKEENTFIDGYEYRLQTKKDLLKNNDEVNNEENFWIPISISRTIIEKVYDIEIECFGEGHFGYIRKAYLKNNKFRSFAVKTIKRNYFKNNSKLILNELNILRTLDHPNIIKFYETYYNDNFFHFVTELCEGGNLEEYVNNKKRIKENEAKRIMYQVFLSINYLHNKNISHRDIKLENFLFQDKNYQTIKLIDFGLSKNFVHDKMSSLLGTPYYVAPEVLKGTYSVECDNWSAGVMLFIWLTGKPPFEADEKKKLFKKIIKNNMTVSKDSWESLSDPLKDLIKKLLNKNPENRIKATEALDHEWFKPVINLKLELGKITWNQEWFSRFWNFKNSNLFKSEILKWLVGLYNNHKEIKSLKPAFFYMDYNNSGYIQKNELKYFFKEFNIQITDKEIDLFIKNLYIKEENCISYTEFLVSCINYDNLINNNVIQTLFTYFDVDNTGLITIKNLKESFKRFGFKYSENYLIEWLNRQEVMNFLQFKNLF